MAFPRDLDPSNPGRWDQEKLAFSLWVARLISEADGGADLSELVLMARLFPDELLRAYGLVDDTGEVTAAWDAARTAAIRHLHTELSTVEKLELITVFHQVCMADQRLVQAELLVLREAAEALGIDVRTLAAHLRTLKD